MLRKIDSFNKYLMNTYSVPGIVLGVAVDTMVGTIDDVHVL